MIFSKSNPPPSFYHYLYVREDGTPYYSGKGRGKRAWEKHKVRMPTDPTRIIITHWGLTELWAIALERWHIRWYGRKDKNTGILRNMTDGGEGQTGAIQSQNKRRKLSGSNNGMHGRSAIVENNLKWYTDGINNIYVTEGSEPPNYKKGRLVPSNSTRERTKHRCVSPIGEIFDSLQEAAEKYNITVAALRERIRRNEANNKHRKNKSYWSYYVYSPVTIS